MQPPTHVGFEPLVGELCVKRERQTPGAVLDGNRENLRIRFELVELADVDRPAFAEHENHARNRL